MRITSLHENSEVSNRNGTSNKNTANNTNISNAKTHRALRNLLLRHELKCRGEKDRTVNSAERARKLATRNIYRVRLCKKWGVWKVSGTTFGIPPPGVLMRQTATVCLFINVQKLVSASHRKCTRILV